MIQGLEVEAARCPPAPLLGVVVLALPEGHALMGQVRDAEGDFAQLFLQDCETILPSLEILTQRGETLAQGLDVFPRRFRRAHRLRTRVSLRLQRLGLRLHPPALFLERRNAIRFEHEAALREALGGRRQVLS